MEKSTRDKVLQLMKEHNVSYGELSNRTKISKSSLQRYVTQDVKVPISRIMVIAKALNTTLSYLLDWDDQNIIDKTDKEFLKMYGTAHNAFVDSEDKDIIKWASTLPPVEEIDMKYTALKHMLNTFGYDLGKNMNGYYLLGDNGISNITDEELESLYSNTIEYIEFSARKLLKEKLK